MLMSEKFVYKWDGKVKIFPLREGGKEWCKRISVTFLPFSSCP